MNRLVLAFGIICLLQGLSAEPRPQFGLTNNIPASAKLTAEKVEAQVTGDAIQGLTVGTLTSGVTKLATTKTKIETVITEFGTKFQAVVAGYDTLVGASDGDIDSAFGPFLTAIDAATTYISGDGAAISTELNGISYTGIADQLTDAFTRIALGLTDLKAKTTAVKTAVLAAKNSAGSATVSAEVLSQFVTLKLAYSLLNSATKLRTYLPLVKYILTVTIENIAEADSYVAGIVADVNSDISAEANQFTSEIERVTTDIENFIGSDLSANAVYVGVVAGRISGYSGITSAPQHSALLAAISSLSNALAASRLVGATSAIAGAFNSISSALSTRITAIKNGINVVDNPLINQLVDVLMGNDEYGRYCYQKYKEPIETLLEISFDAGWMCVDKEVQRLLHLKQVIMLLIDQIRLDFEDLDAQVFVCESLGVAQNSNVATCVSSLATFYSSLYQATMQKVNLIYELSFNEAGASENRLLICFELINLDISVTQVAAMTEGLTICSQSGPTGSD
uniref:Protein TsetseEP domain-containing protein n=1 Tax=Anopheles culicifacies TaxID=139723 RepID=A0A182MCG4_9DIPT